MARRQPNKPEPRRETPYQAPPYKRRERHPRIMTWLSVYYVIVGAVFVAIGAAGIAGAFDVNPALNLIMIIGGGITVIAATLLWTRRKTAWTIMVYTLLVGGLIEAAVAAPGITRLVLAILGSERAIDALSVSIRREYTSVLIGIVALTSFFGVLYLLLPWVHRRFR